MQKISIEFLQYPDIPSDVTVAVHQCGMADSKLCPGERRAREKSGGRRLIAEMVRQKMGPEQFRIVAGEQQKPRGFYNDQTIFLSISHCSRLICGAISADRELGVDIEFLDRKVHPGLKNRITHPAEIEVTKTMPVLQLWTVKESAVKWSGTGLRTPLNRIRILESAESDVRILMPDGRELNSHSFVLHRHWVSVSYSR